MGSDLAEIGVRGQILGGEQALIDQGMAVGHVIWLMSHSEFHLNWQVRDFLRLIFPAIQKDQMLLFYDESGQPCGAVTWAFLTEETEAGLLSATRRLYPSDWNAGDRLWFIDFIAPFGNVPQIIDHMKGMQDFLSFDVARSIRRASDGSMQHVNLWVRPLSG